MSVPVGHGGTCLLLRGHGVGTSGGVRHGAVRLQLADEWHLGGRHADGGLVRHQQVSPGRTASCHRLWTGVLVVEILSVPLSIADLTPPKWSRRFLWERIGLCRTMPVRWRLSPDSCRLTLAWLVRWDVFLFFFPQQFDTVKSIHHNFILFIYRFIYAAFWGLPFQKILVKIQNYFIYEAWILYDFVI